VEEAKAEIWMSAVRRRRSLVDASRCIALREDPPTGRCRPVDGSVGPVEPKGVRQLVIAADPFERRVRRC
jgi:hypothetical protein